MRLEESRKELKGAEQKLHEMQVHHVHYANSQGRALLLGARTLLGALLASLLGTRATRSKGHRH